MFLKQNDVWYSQVKVNENWLNPIPEENEMNNEDNFNNGPDIAENEINSNEVLQKNSISENKESESNSFLDEKLQGVQLDTCLQPADIGQEVLDVCFDQVFEISPAEGNNPVLVLQNEGIEAKTFPIHYPTGKNTFSEERTEKLTLARYFNLRLMSVENRFAQDTSYIFFCQYLSELSKVISNVQISTRKESAYSSDGYKITGEMLCDKNILKNYSKKIRQLNF